MLAEIYCRFTIIDYTTWSFLSLKCVYIFLADSVYVGYRVKVLTRDSQHLFCGLLNATFVVTASLKNNKCVRNAG